MPETLSNFPNGFANGVTIRGVPLLSTYSGRVFWVDDSGGGSKGTFDRPVSTIQAGIDLCTAGRGDIVVVKAGHAETVTTDGGIDADTAGVAVIGLGTGTMRPTVTLGAEAAAVVMSAANCTFMNIVFAANFADITNGVDVTAANAALINCEFTEVTTNMNYLLVINCSSTTDNDADGLWVEGCKSTAIDAGINDFITTAADLNHLTVKGCNVQHLHANALSFIVALTGKDLRFATITDNYYQTLIAASFVAIVADTTTANTGVVARNCFMSRDAAGSLTATAGTNFSFCENYSSGTIDLSGLITPAIS